MKTLLILIQVAIMVLLSAETAAQNSKDEKLNIIVIGAHPDDPDKVGGTAYKWAQMGHNVLLVSLTNGDAGHQSIKAKELARIRREEARRAGEVIGVRYITLDNHDGQLMPTYKNRLQVIRLIR
ncbi:MAG TPA: PIG-L family deacetylase, partial [Bacteroidales bacterium]|nr:PIG-L family deacetylase [Bacteroidales bacterium]